MRQIDAKLPGETPGLVEDHAQVASTTSTTTFFQVGRTEQLLSVRAEGLTSAGGAISFLSMIPQGTTAAAASSSVNKARCPEPYTV